MSEYRLDRTAFKAQTVDEATKSQADYYKTLTWQQRLQIAHYLNSVAYNFPENDPPKMDKTVLVSGLAVNLWVIFSMMIFATLYISLMKVKLSIF